MSHINDGAIAFITPIAIVSLFIGNIHAEVKEVAEFKTNFVSDVQQSSFKQNFIRMSTNNIGTLRSFTYCFRVKLSSIIVQCLFQQDYQEDFGFKFYTENYGFVTLHKAWTVSYTHLRAHET